MLDKTNHLDGKTCKNIEASLNKFRIFLIIRRENVVKCFPLAIREHVNSKFSRGICKRTPRTRGDDFNRGVLT